MEFNVAGTKIRTWMNVNTGETRIRVETAENQWKPSVKEVYGLIGIFLGKCKTHEEEQKLMTMDGGPQIKYDFNNRGVYTSIPGIDEDIMDFSADYTESEIEFFKEMPDNVHVGFYEQMENPHGQMTMEKGMLPLQAFIDRFDLGRGGNFNRLWMALEVYMNDISFDNPETDVLTNVLTVKEASDKWGLAPSTLVSACKGQKGGKPKFTEKECRQSGKTWLITKGAMQRVYGISIDDRIAALEDRIYKVRSNWNNVGSGNDEKTKKLRAALERDKQKIKEAIKELMDLDVVKFNPDKEEFLNRFNEDSRDFVLAFINDINRDCTDDDTEVSEEEETK